MRKVIVCAAFIAAMGLFTTANAQDVKTKKTTETEQCTKKCDSKSDCKKDAKCAKAECKDGAKCTKDAKCSKEAKKECCSAKKEGAKK